MFGGTRNGSEQSAKERKKEADSLSKIESITASLNALKNN